MPERLSYQRHVAWDYEDSVVPYYHIWPVTGTGELVLDGTIELEVPRSAENDRRVMRIVGAINAMCNEASRPL